ncbi:hypothetical protein AGMMS50248_00780 [Deltaproteobacteria bacterium]|nr:hypothetical protein AGMMS50248_00780 [Deltaproteobacteria bacterium]
MDKLEKLLDGGAEFAIFDTPELAVWSGKFCHTRASVTHNHAEIPSRKKYVRQTQMHGMG